LLQFGTITTSKNYYNLVQPFGINYKRDWIPA